jgi:hypothetical protein
MMGPAPADAIAARSEPAPESAFVVTVIVGGTANAGSP